MLASAEVQIAPSSYYAAKSRPPSARQVRDADVTPRLRALWEANYRVYGARKLWKAARRDGIDIGRDQVARLMRAAGIEGVRRGRRIRTTRPDDTATRHPDLVKRDFTAAAPNQLWVTDLTFVPTWAGVAYVCFIVDAYSRMIVGWRVAGAHAHQHGARRDRDGPLVSAAPAPGAALSQRRRVANSPPFATANGSPRSARSPRSGPSATASTTPSPRPSTATTRPSSSADPPDPGPWRTVDDVELGHPRLGPLAQHPAAARLPRRPPTGRVRGGVLRYPTDRPAPGRNPIARASIRPRAVHSLRAT